MTCAQAEHTVVDHVLWRRSIHTLHGTKLNLHAKETKHVASSRRAGKTTKLITQADPLASLPCSNRPCPPVMCYLKPIQFRYVDALGRITRSALQLTRKLRDHGPVAPKAQRAETSAPAPRESDPTRRLKMGSTGLPPTGAVVWF